MTLRYLITANRLSLFQPRFDSTIRIARELLSRGICCDYLDTDALEVSELNPSRLENLPVQEIKSVDLSRPDFFELSERRSESVNTYHALVHRRDPPVDTKFKALSALFAQCPKNRLQINDPLSASTLSEHELPREFPEYSTPTLSCENFEDFKKCIQTTSDETVAKPLNQSSGVGIEFFSKNTEEQTLLHYWKQWGPVVVQPFIKEISTHGDLRIVMFQDTFIGSVTRIPKAGSRLGNLHAGARAARMDPNPKQMKAAHDVALRLNPRGLYFLGLDFIGDYLNEINITSPSALVQIQEVTGEDPFPKLIDAFEKLRKEKFS